ncbi:MAG: hypothetical protein GEV13_27470 [Rhodospirillales bacterium]|nr:hypothetical protein [Rhodospirillales bacterium]
MATVRPVVEKRAGTYALSAAKSTWCGTPTLSYSGRSLGRSATVIVVRTLDPEWLVEIEAIAVA